MTEKEAFEAFHSEVPKGELASRFPNSWIVWQAAWRAATLAERERCAKLVEHLDRRHWFGNQARFSSFIADAIRRGE